MTTNTLNLRKLALSICARFGLNSLHHWVAKPAYSDRPDDAQSLIRADGLTLHLSGPSYSHKDKVEVRLNRPRNKKGEYVTLYAEKGGGTISDPSICMGVTKTGDEMAKDIVRRLLPDAETVFALVKARIDIEDRAAANHLALIRSIASTLGETVEKGHNGEPRTHFYVSSTASPHASLNQTLASIEVRYGGAVHFELDPGESKALALIAFLRSPAYLNA